MIKIIAAAAFMSLVVCSATGAGAVPSASGLNDPAASGIVQVKGRGGHARASGRSRGHASHRGGGFQRGRYARNGRGYSRGYYGRDYGYGGDDWGSGFCTWVGPFQVCP
jgi:hypothetical protein